MHPEAYTGMAATEASHWWFAGRRAILTSILSDLQLPKNAQILEIGAGTGGNLDMLAQFGQVYAIEMDSAAREIATAKTGGRFDIQAGSCPHDLPFTGRKFDLICLFDVLEHIEQDTETLTVLKRQLAPGGRLLLTVPAYQWMWSSHDVFLHHKRRYSAAELQEKACSSGLKTDRISYFNTLLFPLAVSARLVDRLSGATSASGTTIPPRPANRALRQLFAAERFLLRIGNLPFGVSLLGIFRQNGR